MSDQEELGSPEWFTGKMKDSGWESAGENAIGRYLGLGQDNDGQKKILAVIKEEAGWGQSCGKNGCGLKRLPATWNVMILNADGSPIYKSELVLTANLVQEYIAGGKRYSIRRSDGPIMVPVAAYGVWFDTGTDRKAIALTYSVVCLGKNPATICEGELNFCE